MRSIAFFTNNKFSFCNVLKRKCWRNCMVFVYLVFLEIFRVFDTMWIYIVLRRSLSGRRNNLKKIGTNLRKWNKNHKKLKKNSFWSICPLLFMRMMPFTKTIRVSEERIVALLSRRWSNSCGNSPSISFVEDETWERKDTVGSNSWGMFDGFAFRRLTRDLKWLYTCVTSSPYRLGFSFTLSWKRKRSSAIVGKSGGSNLKEDLNSSQL